MLPNQILTKRPEWMDHEKYKELRRNQNKSIRFYLQGKFAWISARLIPKTDSQGKVIEPIKYIGKTPGDTYNRKLHGELKV